MNKNKRTGCRISALLMTVALTSGASMGAMAAEEPVAETTAATEGSNELDMNQKGSIFVSLVGDDGVAMPSGRLALYQVAEIELNDWNMTYSYTEAFADCGEELTQEALDDPAAMLAVALAQWASDEDVTAVRETDIQNGEVTFSDLPLGVYLVVQTQKADGFYLIDSFLVSLPHMEDGIWVYGVNAAPKVQVNPEPEPKTNPESEPNPEPEPEPEPEPQPETKETEKTSSPGTTTSGTTSGGGTSSGGSSGSNGSTSSEKLPQTGQLNWPIPLLAGGGIVLILVGGALILSDRRKRSHAA